MLYPTLTSDPDDELDYLWPGHQVTEVQVQFTLNMDHEPDLQRAIIYDKDGLKLTLTSWPQRLLDWFDEQFNSASDSRHESWWDQQCELWDAEGDSNMEVTND